MAATKNSKAGHMHGTSRIMSFATTSWMVVCPTMNRGAANNPLLPFVSVASNDHPHFTKLFVPELRNLRLPGGKVHNGCVRVDDRFGESTACRLDSFVVLYTNYASLRDGLPDWTPVFANNNCQILSYGS